MSRVPPLARLVSLLIFVVATFINVRIVPLAIVTALSFLSPPTKNWPENS